MLTNTRFVNSAQITQTPVKISAIPHCGWIRKNKILYTGTYFCVFFPSVEFRGISRKTRPCSGKSNNAYIVKCFTFSPSELNPKGDPAEESSNPQENGEPSDHLLEKFDYLGGGFRRSECVGTISGQNLCSSCSRKTLKETKKC